MESGAKIAVVAALEREVRPLVKGWRVVSGQYEGRTFKFFKQDAVVLVCGGMGAPAARRATEAIIQLYEPEVVISAGFAGALQPGMKPGDLFTPETVIDAKDGSRVATGSGWGTLVSFDAVAGASQKAKLARSYGAQAVDMEAAAVARGAETHGVRFAACKAISDASEFAMPAMERFTAADGQFKTTWFLLYAALRPWWWRAVGQLARNSRLAARRLSAALAAMKEQDAWQAQPHPVGNLQ